MIVVGCVVSLVYFLFLVIHVMLVQEHDILMQKHLNAHMHTL